MWRSATLPAGLVGARIEHDDLVAQALRGHAEHAAELAAAQEPEPGAGQRSWSRSGLAPVRAARASRAPSRSASRGTRRASSRRPDRSRRASRRRTSPALAAPASPIANVATGMPFGICTIESSESSPRRYFDGTGTPSTGTVVFAASMPGRCAAPPAPAMMHAQSARAARPRRTRTCRRACDARTARAPRMAMPNASSCAAAWRMISQSLSLPITTPTCGARLALCHRSSPMRRSGGLGRRPAHAARSSGGFYPEPLAPYAVSRRVIAAGADVRLPKGPASPTIALCNDSSSRSSPSRFAHAAAFATARALGRRFPGGEIRVRTRASEPDSTRWRRVSPATCSSRTSNTGSWRFASTTPRRRRDRAFLAEWPDSPLADRLRIDWLKVLGKRGDWATFDALYSARRRRRCRARLRRDPESPATRRRRGARRREAAVVHAANRRPTPASRCSRR